jgi:acyl-[acyl-carrier-protein] desaturase
VNPKIEAQFFDHYLEFFRLAEERRRWNLWRDIPWDQTNPEASDLIATVVESFSAVEMFLPDYTAKILHLIRKSRGRAWFQANWGYEESKHSLALAMWLVRSGKRTEEGMRAFENSLLDNSEWELPFDHPRQMIIYTMIQELATWLNYWNLKDIVEKEGDMALVRALHLISADEKTHYNFFRKGVKIFMEAEPAETLADIKYVFEKFTMPAQTLIPGWEEKAAEIHKAGIYGPRQFVTKVYLPILADLGLTRKELEAAGAPQHMVQTENGFATPDGDITPGRLLGTGKKGGVLRPAGKYYSIP